MTKFLLIMVVIGFVIYGINTNLFWLSKNTEEFPKTLSDNTYDAKSLQHAKQRSVRILEKGIINNENCFGTIVNKNTIVAANHCMKGSKSGLIITTLNGVRFGSGDIKKIYRIGSVGEEDIAIIKLNKDLSDGIYQEDIVQYKSSDVKSYNSIYMIRLNNVETCREHESSRELQQYDAIRGKILITCNAQEGYSGAPVFNKYRGRYQFVGILGGEVFARNVGSNSGRYIYVTEVNKNKSEIYRYINR